MEGDIGIIQALCELWPEATRVADCIGRLPLHIASNLGAALETVKLLVSTYEGSTDDIDDAGSLPLHSSAACCVGGCTVSN